MNEGQIKICGYQRVGDASGETRRKHESAASQAVILTIPTLNTNSQHTSPGCATPELQTAGARKLSADMAARKATFREFRSCTAPGAT